MGRELKTTKAKLENLIKYAWIETDRGRNIKTKEYQITLLAVEMTKKYFAMHDFLHGTNHLHIFTKLYLTQNKSDKHSFKKLFFEVSKEFNFFGEIEDMKDSGSKKKGRGKITKTSVAVNSPYGKNTMTNYTNLYIDCFQKYLKDILGEKTE